MIIIVGASSGIGAACARAFAAKGKALTLLARRMDKLELLKKELVEKFSAEVHLFSLDVRNRAAFENLIQKNASLFSRCEVLINNAGLAKGMDRFQEGSFEDWETMIDTNVKGLLYGTRLIVPFMIQSKKGHIINLGSVAGRWNYNRGNIYCATKAAVRALNESLRLDLLGTGIRVTEIAPGMVETEFSEVRLGNSEKAKAVYAGMKPLVAEDIAEAVVWSVERPAHVNIQEMVIYPTDQASPSSVNRR